MHQLLPRALSMDTHVANTVCQPPQPEDRSLHARRKIACPVCRKKKRTCLNPRVGEPCQTCIDRRESASCNGSEPTEANIKKREARLKKKNKRVASLAQEPLSSREITSAPSVSYRQDKHQPFPMGANQYSAPPSAGQAHGSTIISGEYHYEDGHALGHNHMTVASSPQRSVPQEAFEMGAYYSYHTVYSADPTYHREFVPFETPQGLASSSSHDAFVEVSSRGWFDPRYLSKH